MWIQRWYRLDTLLCLQHLATVELVWDHRMCGYSCSSGNRGTKSSLSDDRLPFSTQNFCPEKHSFCNTPGDEPHTCAFWAVCAQQWLCHARGAHNVFRNLLCRHSNKVVVDQTSEKLSGRSILWHVNIKKLFSCSCLFTLFTVVLSVTGTCYSSQTCVYWIVHKLNFLKMSNFLV